MSNGLPGLLSLLEWISRTLLTYKDLLFSSLKPLFTMGLVPTPVSGDTSTFLLICLYSSISASCWWILILKSSFYGLPRYESVTASFLWFEASIAFYYRWELNYVWVGGVMILLTLPKLKCIWVAGYSLPEGKTARVLSFWKVYWSRFKSF